MKNVAIIILVVAVATYISLMLIPLLKYMVVSRKAIKLTKPFNRNGTRDAGHILVLGDSTMYSAGVKQPENTMGGLLSSKYPGYSVETLATNGARAQDLAGQLSRANYQKYDFILIGIGGNDVVRLTSFNKLQTVLKDFLVRLSDYSDTVVMCNSVNVGNIGFFLFPLNHLFDYRSRRFGHICTTLASASPTVQFINLYRPIGDDHYDASSRHKFIAPDGFHANDFANKYFFDLIWRKIQHSHHG